ncbi:MAG: hypothetical protein WAL91_06245 [Propionicimonas sp.]
MVDLVIAQRSDLLAEALPRLLLPIENSNASVLVGARSHEQASGVAQLWAPLLDALRALASTGTDVIVDGGRLGLNGWPRPLVLGSDLTLLVMSSDLPSLAAARSWADTLAAEDLAGHAIRVVVVGAGRPYGVREVARTLGVPVLASIEWAPEQARVYSHGATIPEPSWWRRLGGRTGAASRSFEASPYIRSVEAAGEAIRAMPDAEAPSPLRSVLAQAGAVVEGRTRR